MPSIHTLRRAVRAAHHGTNAGRQSIPVFCSIHTQTRTGGGGGGRVGSGIGSGGGCGGSGGLGGGSGGSGGSGGLGGGSSRQDAGSVGTGATARYVPQSFTGPARTATA
jgi:hypothetical protein